MVAVVSSGASFTGIPLLMPEAVIPLLVPEVITAVDMTIGGIGATGDIGGDGEDERTTVLGWNTEMAG